MTIDEAIECEKEKTEHAKEEYLMLQDDNWTDIETYEKRLKNCANFIEYHEQIAEWLEELKSIKELDLEIPQHFTKEQSDWIKSYVILKKKEARQDAIDEIHTELIAEIAMLNATDMTDANLYAFAVRVKEITDKLISK